MVGSGPRDASAERRSHIFICYRRDDTSGHAGRLYDRLSARFGAERIFIDVDKIGPGVDFLAGIEEAVEGSGVLLALIGPGWLSITGPGGQRRLDDPEDVVRLELAFALERDLLVIPLLIQGAQMPRADELPAPLVPLVRRNALELSNERFDYDVTRITEAAEQAIGEPAALEKPSGVCPSCGQENPEIAQFCVACGTRLEQGRAPAEERKIVTVSFFDLVSSAGPSDEVDPEDVRARVRPYHALIRREIERFGGTAEKSIGEAIMAVFGAPTAHEDDVERSVRAALRILEALPELNESQDLSLAMRAGIATGEAVVGLGAGPGESEAAVTGDVVSASLRFQSLAPPGAVVVGEATYLATRDLFNYTELPPVAAPGKTEPVPMWQAHSPRSRTGTEIESPTTPFVGREDDLELLKLVYRKALREPSVQLVTVTGEPGVGKTRLIGEFFGFIDDLEDIVYWRQGRCLPYGEGITFWALGEIVKAQSGILESDGPEDAQAKLTASVEGLIVDARDREWLKTRLGPLVGLETPGGPAERDETFTAWRRYLEAVAAKNPLVMVVEDLHSADPAMLDFVEHLAEYASGVPLLMIASARLELYERRPGWAGGLRGATTISLAPLSDSHCAKLISALLDQAVLPADVQAELLARAGGNPLYAEEFVRMLSDRGLITQKGKLVEVAQMDDLELPTTVQALIAARIDTLPPERKALLHDASVIGRVFWSGAVAAMSERDEQSVGRDLHELARKELVRAARTSTVEGEVEYTFWHSLVRDVCYAQIPRAERGRKHRAAAEWIEAIAGERVADHADFLAHHYRQAFELARASGDTDKLPELAEACMRFLAMAGERAMPLDVARAESLYRAALDLGPPGHPDRGAVRAKLGEALFTAGQLEEAEAAFGEAMEELKSRNDLLAAGETMVLLARTLRYSGDATRCRQLLTEAIDTLEALPPGRELIRAHDLWAYERYMSGFQAEGLAAAERALQLARDLHLDVEEVRPLGRRGAALGTLGDPRGVEDLRTALERALALGLGRDTAVLYNNLAELLWPAEGPAAALASYREGASFARTRGMLFNAHVALASSLGPLIQLGEWEEALALSTEVVEWLAARGAALDEACAAAWRAHLFLGRGEWKPAEAIVQKYLPPSREMGDVELLLPTLAAAALLARSRENLQASVKFVREFGEAARNLGTWYRAQFLPGLVRICRETQEVGLAAELVEGVPDRLPGHRLALSAARAALAEARGELEEGLRSYEEAAESMQRFGWVVEHGQALLGQGRCLLGLGRSDQATSKVQAAHEVFARLGARPLLAETEELLGLGTALSS